MRCKNCGWPNRPGEAVCVKCNSPLGVDNSAETRMENFPDEYDNAERSSLKATIAEDTFFGGHDEEGISDNVCPKCGYPLRDGVSICPNCKYEIRDVSQNNVVRENHVVTSNNKPTRMENQLVKKPVSGTINPYMVQADPEPTFILKPLQRINEKKVLNDMEYEGKEVVLNRDNTEPENGSITSLQQASVINENGRWYIEDKSEQGTTFVRASHRIELSDGDTILLGNRLFEFHV